MLAFVLPSLCACSTCICVVSVFIFLVLVLRPCYFFFQCCVFLFFECACTVCFSFYVLVLLFEQMSVLLFNAFLCCACPCVVSPVLLPDFHALVVYLCGVCLVFVIYVLFFIFTSGLCVWAQVGASNACVQT